MYRGTNTIMPLATMANITMKSMRAARVKSMYTSSSHKPKMQANLIHLPVVILLTLLLHSFAICKVTKTISITIEAACFLMIFFMAMHSTS